MQICVLFADWERASVSRWRVSNAANQFARPRPLPEPRALIGRLLPPAAIIGQYCRDISRGGAWPSPKEGGGSFVRTFVFLFTNGSRNGELSKLMPLMDGPFGDGGFLVYLYIFFFYFFILSFISTGVIYSIFFFFF